MLNLSIIPAQCSVLPTTLTLAPPSRLCYHSTMAVRSSCVQWTTATVPACPLCPDTMDTHPTHVHPLSPGHRNSHTRCLLQLLPCPSPCRTSQCVGTGLAPHRVTGTLTSTASMENLQPNTMSQVNHPFSIPPLFLWLLFPFAFSLFILSQVKQPLDSNGTLSCFILVKVSLVALPTTYLTSQVYKSPVCHYAVLLKNCGCAFEIKNSPKIIGYVPDPEQIILRFAQGQFQALSSSLYGVRGQGGRFFRI